MNEFTKDELKGREIIKDVLKGKCTIEFTLHPYDSVDAYSTGKTISVIEIKNRDISENTYPDVMLEMTKFMALQKAMLTHPTEKALYITIFRENIYAWDIAKTKVEDLKWEWVPCTETTAENYGETIVMKLVTFLKKENALWKKPRTKK